MAIAQKLSQLSKAWKKAQPITTSFETVPDGDYVAKLLSMEISESKTSGRLQVVSTFEIMDGEYEGSKVKRFDGIEEETNMGYFKGYCVVIGCELPSELTMLQESLNEFVSNNSDLFNITLKTKGKDGIQNLYVNGVSDLVESEEGNEEEELEVVNEDDVEQEEEEQEEEEEEQEVVPSSRNVKLNVKTITKGKVIDKGKRK